MLDNQFSWSTLLHISSSGEFHLDPAVMQELQKPTINLRKLAIGSVAEVVFAEDDDAERQARLKLLFKSPDTDDETGKFEVVEAKLDPEIIRLNAKAGMPILELMGGEIWVNFACTYRRGSQIISY